MGGAMPEDKGKVKGGGIMGPSALVRLEPEDEILTSREARDLLKIGRTKLWQLTGENVIPAYRLGHGKTSALRYKRSELLAWLEDHRIRSPHHRDEASSSSTP
jgi:excisionase family DNA binding protein